MKQIIDMNRMRTERLRSLACEEGVANNLCPKVTISSLRAGLDDDQRLQDKTLLQAHNNSSLGVRS